MTEAESRLPAGVGRVLIDEAVIARRLDAMATEIVRCYEGKPLTAIVVLTGSLMFAADLLRRVPLPLRIDCLSVASYHGGIESSGTVTFRQETLPDVAGREVLILDDILDTGRTLEAVRRRLIEEARPAGVRIAVLLRKRKVRAVAVEADFAGFEIGDEFVVGYGLDYRDQFRNLPFIGVLS